MLVPLDYTSRFFLHAALEHDVKRGRRLDIHEAVFLRVPVLGWSDDERRKHFLCSQSKTINRRIRSITYQEFPPLRVEITYEIVNNTPCLEL